MIFQKIDDGANITLIATVTHGYEHVAHEPVTPRSLDRCASKPRPELRVVKSEQFAKRWIVGFLSCSKPCFARSGGKLVPRAHRQAVITPENAVGDGAAVGARDMTFVFDRQVGDATPGVELIGCRKCIGRANIDTAPARTTAIFVP